MHHTLLHDPWRYNIQCLYSLRLPITLCWPLTTVHTNSTAIVRGENETEFFSFPSPFWKWNRVLSFPPPLFDCSENDKTRVFALFLVRYKKRGKCKSGTRTRICSGFAFSMYRKISRKDWPKDVKTELSCSEDIVDGLSLPDMPSAVSALVSTDAHGESLLRN